MRWRKGGAGSGDGRGEWVVLDLAKMGSGDSDWNALNNTRPQHAQFKRTVLLRPSSTPPSESGDSSSGKTDDDFRLGL